MAKKKTTRRSQTKQDTSAAEAADLRAAEAAVRIAQEELDRALGRYRDVRQQATETFDRLKESSAGELLNDSFDYVSRHPKQGLLLAGLLGFFLGRLFRR